MDINKKSQTSGDHSVNVQAETVTVSTGLSIAHVKEIALDVFDDNFYKLAGEAQTIADERAKEITDQFLNELSTKNPNGLEASKDPDFQYSLFQVQKEYARCGDKELGDILVDILVDRSKEEERSLLQVVLNESLTIAPKLNTTQLDMLACLFNMSYTKRTDITSIQKFADYLNDAVLVFADALQEKDSNYRHLEYVGCAAIRSGTRDTTQTLIERYKPMFSKGFEKELLNDIAKSSPKIWQAVIRNLHNVNLVQTCGLDDEITQNECRRIGLSEDITQSLIKINNQHIMNKEEANIFIGSICPKYTQFITYAEKGVFKSLELTSVGIAIAHAHSRKKVGFSADLSIWI